MTRLLLTAGDASGDLHAADFVRAFRERRADARFVGLGGAAMSTAGVEPVGEPGALAVGGLLELASSARAIAGAWRAMTNALERERPDLVVLVDSGGFNLPFARHVRRHSGAPIFYYVAPQVWAWRRGRIGKLARRVDRLAVIFPFEPEVYAGTSLPVEFVGHPLVEPMRDVVAKLDRDTAARALGLDPQARWVALMPGSRRNEIRHQLPVQLEAARVLHGRDPRLAFTIAVASSIEPGRIEGMVRDAGLPGLLQLRIVQGSTAAAIRASDVVLAKPGTVTVEAALLERPMVVMGRAHPLTAAVVRRAVRVPSLAMPNLIAGCTVVPEFLQQEARPEAIADALLRLIEGPERERQLEDLAAVRARLGAGGGPRRVAEIAEEMLGRA